MLDPIWLDFLMAFLATPAAVVQAIEMLRAHPTRYWVAPVGMLPVITIVCFTGARLLPLSAAAVASWVVLLFACLTHRRRFAVGCIALCGLFAASSKLAGVAEQRANAQTSRASSGDQ